MTIRAVYENGVFRPTTTIGLPEGTAVELHVVEREIDVRSLVPPGTDEGLIQIYEILARRYESGHSDTAERHNEPKRPLPGPPPGWTQGRISTAAGALADDWTEEDDRILEEIHRARRSERRGDLPE
jgi:predicted DNA-binding antitoxin AbrB/MazE fold protein